MGRYDFEYSDYGRLYSSDVFCGARIVGEKKEGKRQVFRVWADTDGGFDGRWHKYGGLYSDVWIVDFDGAFDFVGKFKDMADDT